jgi:hypothetical protein
MLSLKRRTAAVAAASLFAALYAVLGTIPISRLLLGNGNFLTAGKFVTPLCGMIFGPVVGGLAALIGDLIDAYSGFLVLGPTGFAVMAADLTTVLTAGLAFSGKRVAAIALPVAMVLLYWLDPISVLFVGWIPFSWLHIISIIVLLPILMLESKGRISKLNPIFIAGVTFASLMCGQITGTLVGQELSVRFLGTLALSAWRKLVPLFFTLYPVERIFFTIVGSLISVPILRALSRMRQSKTELA